MKKNPKQTVTIHFSSLLTVKENETIVIESMKMIPFYQKGKNFMKHNDYVHSYDKTKNEVSIKFMNLIAAEDLNEFFDYLTGKGITFTSIISNN